MKFDLKFNDKLEPQTTFKERAQTFIEKKVDYLNTRYIKSTIRNLCLKLSLSTHFSVFILLCIAVTTVTLSLDRYPIDQDFFE